MAELSDRLVVVLEAKIDKLQDGIDKAVAKVSGGGARIQKIVDDTNKRMERFGDFNPGEAFERVFSRSRLAVFEEGGAKIGVFGTALEALGPAGLTAAASLAAVAIAGEQAKKAMEFADDLDRSAKALGVSTTALQEFDYANIALSVGADKGREALAAFNGVLGNYASGLLAAKQSKFFAAIGITPEDARAGTDVIEKLEATLLALAKLPTQSQRAGAASKLGLEAFLPVLGEGTEGVEKLVAKLKEAQAAGGVIGPGDIARAAELNDKLEATQKLIDLQIKSAFIELAPLVLRVAELIEQAAKAGADLAHGIQDAARGAADFAARLPKIPVPKGAADAAGRGFASGASAGAQGFLKAQLGPLGNLLDVVGAFRQRGAELRAADDAAVPAPSKATGSILATPKAAKPVNPNSALEVARASADALADAQRALLDGTKAQLGVLDDLTDDAQARLAIQTQLIDAERDSANAAIEKKRADLANAAQQGKITAAAADEARASLAVAEAQNALTATIKKIKATRDADLAQADKDLAHSQAINQFYDDILSTTASLARTSAERRDAELKLLAYQKQEADRVRANQRAHDVASAPDEAGRAAANAAADSIQGSANDKYASDRQRVLHDTQGPLDAFRDSTLKTAAEVGEALQSEAVKGLDDFNDGLAQAITQGGSLGDVMHSVFATLEADAIRYLAKQAEIGVLGDGKGGTGLFGSLLSSAGSLFGHHATGADSFGGITRLNEEGPEGLAYVPKGTQIIPNATLRAIANMAVPQRQSGGSQFSIKIDLAGANGDAAIAEAARSAALEGARLAITHTDARFESVARGNRNRLGR